MGSTIRQFMRKTGAVLLAVCLVLGLNSTAGLAPSAEGSQEPYGTSVGDMAAIHAGDQGAKVGTDVNVAVKGNLSAETTPALTTFDYPEQLTGSDRYLVSIVKGGVKVKDAADGLPYAFNWTRQIWDAATKAFADEDPGDPYKMGIVTAAEATDEGMRVTYDLLGDTYRMNTLYQYTFTVFDDAGNTCVNRVEVFCGNEYVYGTITNGKKGARDAVETVPLAEEPETTIVDVTAMRLFDSELVISELGHEMRSMLLPYAQGNVMDSACNVSLVSERATADKPVFITPPMVKLAIRLHDQSVEAGWPVKVLAIQDGKVVTVSEEDAVVELDADNYKIARVGVLDDDVSGVDELGVFAVTYPPKGGEDDQVKVTSQACMPVGVDGFGAAMTAGGSVAPQDVATTYAVGSEVRYTFLPDEGYAFDFVTLGTNADGAKNPRVTEATDCASLGENFLDLTVYKPDVTGELYVSAYFKRVGTPNPVNPDPTDSDPVDPMLTHQIWAAAGEGGTIGPDGTFRIRTGESETFTVMPEDGFDVDNVTVNGHTVALMPHAGGFYTVTLQNISCNMVVLATFKEAPDHTMTEDPLQVSVTTSGPGEAAPMGTVKVGRGEGLTVTLMPDGACRLLTLTRDGHDVTADVAQNLTYRIDNLQASTRLHATFADAAGNPDPVVPGSCLITTQTRAVCVQNMFGDTVGGFVVPSRAVVDAGGTQRLIVKPANGSYAVSATKVVRAVDGTVTETPLAMHPFKVAGQGDQVTGGIRMPYSYVDVEADAEEVLVRVVFDGCEYDPENPGGHIDPDDPNPPTPGSPDAPDRYVYEEEPAPMQHRVDIEVVAPDGVPGGVVTAARNGQQIGVAGAYVMMDHEGMLSLSAFPYGGYAAEFSVAEGAGNLQEGSDAQASVPQVGDCNHVLGAPISKSYKVTGAAKVRITFKDVGGYTPPVPEAGTSLFHAVSVGAGTVSPSFASAKEGGPAAAFTVIPDKGYRVMGMKLYDQTTGHDVSDKLPAVSVDGGTVEMGFIGEGAYVVAVVFGKATEGPDGSKPPVDPVDPTDPENPYDPDKPVDPSAKEYTLTACVGRDLDAYKGDGSVSIVGATQTDAAGNPYMKVKASQKAVVMFMPAENSTLAYVTLTTPGSVPREVSVLNSRLVLTSFTADTTITAYFRYGTFIHTVELSVGFSQNLTPEECGWELTGAPADKVPYGDSLTAMVTRVEGSDKADDYQLKSLTVNGEEHIGDVTSAALRRAAGSDMAYYTLDNVTRDTQVRATFAYEPQSVGPGPTPPSPAKPDSSSGSSSSGGSGGSGSTGGNGSGSGSGSTAGLVTVTTSTSGHGTISPKGRVAVPAGKVLTFTLKPSAGFQPVSVTLTDSRGTRTVKQTTTQLSIAVNEDTTLVANFGLQAYPGPSDPVSRIIRHLQSLAKTGDIQMVGALALVSVACAAGGVAIFAARHRKQEADAEGE